MLGEHSIVCNAEGLLFRMKRLYTRCCWNKAYKNMTYTFDIITVSFVSC